MNIRKVISSIFSAVLLLSGCAESDNISVSQSCTESTEASVNASDESASESFGQLECLYYSERDFGVFDSMSSPYDIDGELMCVTVPHHLLAGKMISSAFKTAAATRENIETAVIVAPIHEPQGDDVCTTLSDWNTPFGALENDRELSVRFSAELGAAYDDRMLQTDHSASGLIPFVRCYFPGAKVSCLLVSGQADSDIPRRISELLCEISEEKDCFFIFSTDFSHYLEPHEAERMDEETCRAVLERDITAISAMTNDNTDSPPTLEAFVRLSELSGCRTVQLDHGNSLSVSGVPYGSSTYPDGVTSYFVFGAEM